jgi:hypothetical protein
VAHWKKLNEDPKPKAEHKPTTLAKTEEALPISSEALNIAQRNAINSRPMLAELKAASDSRVTSNTDWRHEIRDASLDDVKTALVPTLKRVLPAPIMAHASLQELVPDLQMRPLFKLDFIADPYGSAEVQQKVQRKPGGPRRLRTRQLTRRWRPRVETPYCSFSGKSYYEVEYMIPGDGIRQVFICTECITRYAKRLNNIHLASTKCAGMR